MRYAIFALLWLCLSLVKVLSLIPGVGSIRRIRILRARILAKMFAYGTGSGADDIAIELALREPDLLSLLDEIVRPENDESWELLSHFAKLVRMAHEASADKQAGHERADDL